jgi:hypothetical protein
LYIYEREQKEGEENIEEKRTGVNKRRRGNRR